MPPKMPPPVTRCGCLLQRGGGSVAVSQLSKPDGRGHGIASRHLPARLGLHNPLRVRPESSQGSRSELPAQGPPQEDPQGFQARPAGRTSGRMTGRFARAAPCMCFGFRAKTTPDTPAPRTNWRGRAPGSVSVQPLTAKPRTTAPDTPDNCGRRGAQKSGGPGARCLPASIGPLIQQG